MKLRGSGFVVFVMGSLIAVSCFNPPEYSTIPTIEFDNIIFKDIADPSSPDSLIVTVRFKDGDGDLGLSADNPNDNLDPYYNKKYFAATPTTLVNYKLKRTDPKYAYLPAFVSPYNCINWEITTINNKTDTLYFELNPNHYNIFIEYYIKNADGTFKKFDWMTEFIYPNCGVPFDGRFPRLFKEPYRKTPMEGSIRYGMPSVGFLILFSIKTLKLRIHILDRALNSSNVVETPEFTLQSIKKSG